MSTRKQTFRNIAIIAHVDHGKTTLVDGMLQQSGTYHEHEEIVERVMDSMDLERERGITITSKNTSVRYNEVKINIVDTPGHADFGGEVERSLNMVDGVLLLVDASEGPLPQTRFVLGKALHKQLPVVVVINKIDRSDARIDEVLNDIYDLFIDLDANEDQIDFPVLYTNARDGHAHYKLEDDSQDLQPLFKTIMDAIPGPIADDEANPQLLVTNIAYDAYVGQIAIGRLSNGILEMNSNYSLCGRENVTRNIKFSACYTFEGLKREQVDQIEAGDIVGVAGVDGVAIGDTITSLADPVPLPRITVDEPTVSMVFYVNNGPFAGRDGKYVTSRHLADRLERESLGNVSLQVDTSTADGFKVSGRGELQMAVLIETMRREGYEFMVSKPQVITHEKNGKVQEPMEAVFIDVPEENVGVITERLAKRKGRMTSLHNHGHGRVNMEFRIPSRGLIGFRSQFLTETRGAGVMNTLFDGYENWFGPIPQRINGAILSDRTGVVTAYASLAMADRGILFSPIGADVYEGMIIGERNRSGDLEVNICRAKKLTSMRAVGSDATIPLRPPKILSLDESIEFIAEDELVVATPNSIHLRKMILSSVDRNLARKRAFKAGNQPKV